MVHIPFGTYLISDDKSRLDLETVLGFLQRSYWAKAREAERTKKAIENSRCYGVYDAEGRQVAFARVITDGATAYYLCDVFVDENHRGSGIGKAMVEAIIGSEELKGITGMLATADAHGLYEKYGFVKDAERFMRKPIVPN
ncbi:GNAT family N-acetyltransferase [Cohnella sp. CFH 77786]|uniref:GNAT family N-acetyltransferase n=1 Tax=Cohnella sp. CFH 77786 TaxID=2662265 RepID=UPI00351D9BE7